MARVEGLECWVRTQGDVERAFPEGRVDEKIRGCEGEM
jgi:hypothetical protein